MRKHAQVPVSPIPAAPAPMSPGPKSPFATGRVLSRARRPKRSQRIESPISRTPISKSQSGGRRAERLERVDESDRELKEQRKATSLSLRSKLDNLLTPLKTDGSWFTPAYYGGSPVMRCDSPEGLFCEGWCQPDEFGEFRYPDVISLSAAKDGERAWEDEKGSSMTQVSPLMCYTIMPLICEISPLFRFCDRTPILHFMSCSSQSGALSAASGPPPILTWLPLQPRPSSSISRNPCQIPRLQETGETSQPQATRKGVVGQNSSRGRDG